jgi:hypothetical protein
MPYLQSHTVAFGVKDMQSRYTVHITAAEWRWVVLVGCGLVLLAFLPLLWVALLGNSQWQFMGALHNYLDGATYLSKMRIGMNGDWLVYFQHTPELHSGVAIQVLYPLLGHVSRFTSIPPIVLFHVARVFASLFMYIALYQLAASIWTRIRARRVFFVIAVLGAGLGWLFAPLTQLTFYPDLAIPEAFPFFSTLMNVHFPLTISCLALLVGLLIAVFRPGAEADPALELGYPIAGLLSVVLAVLYPQALVPIGGAVVLSVASLLVRERRVPRMVWRWMLAVILPPIPFALYYFSIVAYNPAFADWNAQNYTEAPPIWAFALGFGLPLLVALPGIYRGIRRFERDGDRFMLLWLIGMLVVIYLPTNIQRRFAVGFIIPVAYFAARAVEDVWLTRVSRRWRNLLFAAFVPLIALSQILMLFFPVLFMVAGTPERAVGVFLPRDYRDVYEWIQDRTRSDDVVLASPVVSAWVPGWADARVVYGHPYETLDAETKLHRVENWYAGTEECAALIEEYDIRFILFGPEEAKLGSAPCLAEMQVVARSGDVLIYAP